MDAIRKNLDRTFQDFWKKHRVLTILLLAALIFDTVSTIYFMQNEGIELEIHPLVRASATLFGPISGTILSAFLFRAVAGLMLAVYLRRFSAWVLIIPIITSTVAGFINFFGHGILPYYS
ncbi:MAG: hypothetical protein ISS71_02615 [Phycisphaerae bacterium]|nr:hypothetical protein [Phycisphaerae bacterium]